MNNDKYTNISNTNFTSTKTKEEILASLIILILLITSIFLIYFFGSAHYNVLLEEGTVTKKTYNQNPFPKDPNIVYEEFSIVYTNEEQWNFTYIPESLFNKIQIGDTYSNKCVCIIEQ